MGIKQKIKMTKRTIILLGLSGLLTAWAVLAVYGAVCVAKKIGWL